MTREMHGQNREEIRDKVVNWLLCEKHVKDYEGYISRRVKNTSRWMLDSVPYKTWRDPQSSTTKLGFHGLSGAGKSFIATAVIDDISKDQQTRGDGHAKIGLAYVYFSLDLGNESSDGLLSHILGQLTKELPDESVVATPYQDVKDFYDLYHNSYHRGTMSERLVDVLVDVVAWYDNVFLVVDALDQCAPDTTLTELEEHLYDLQTRLGHDRCKLRILTTSTTEDVLRIDDKTKQLMEVRAEDEDIKVYIQSQLDKGRGSLRGISDNDKQEIIKVIIKEADGV